MLFFTKQIIILISCIAVIFFFVAVPLSTARTVFIIYGGELGITEKEANNMAIIDALLADTEDFLLCKLPQRRRESIGQYLSMISQGIISNVTIFEPKILEDGRIKGIFDVPIRKKALYNIIRQLGIPYTLTKLQPYTLRYVAPEDKLFLGKISLLEDVSGVMQKEQSDSSEVVPILQLIFEEGQWTGSISEGVNTLHESKGSLDNVWRELWGEFFSQRQREAVIHSQEYFLDVSGWKHASGVEELGNVLKQWETSVQHILLHEVIINKGMITAQWTVTLVNSVAFEEQIKKYALARNLQYGLHLKKVKVDLESTVGSNGVN